MTLQERLDDANRRSVALYLRRQQIEEQRQQVQAQAQQLTNVARATDMEFVKLDGEIAAFTALLADEPKP